MAGRFPGARNVHEFWRNLRAGVESVRPLSDDQLLRAGVDPELLSDPNYIKVSSALDDVGHVRRSRSSDLVRVTPLSWIPNNGTFWNVAGKPWKTPDGIPSSFQESVGVYAGSGFNSYLIHNLLPNLKLMKSAGEFVLRQTGNDKDVLATRASYHLNLTGPSMTIQTACSTSLVAIHVACQSLLNHECDMALAGGVTIEIPHRAGYEYREGEILSRDGHCRSFDAALFGDRFWKRRRCRGSAPFRGCARATETTFSAVILGTAINNDGSRKVGYLAPSVAGQAEVVAEALSVAGVEADSISYVETHGTGTLVGDPIEVSALTAAFRQSTDRRGYCAIGSVKSNIGHLDAAAGVAGFIKTVLALKHRQIPPSLNFSMPNPLIDFENSPFFVNTELARLAEWDAPTPRRRDVARYRRHQRACGCGGSAPNCSFGTVPEIPASNHLRQDRVGSRFGCHAAGRFPGRASGPNLADVAFTLHRGRTKFAHRRAVVCQTAG